MEKALADLGAVRQSCVLTLRASRRAQHLGLGYEELSALTRDKVV
jgi:hypothetical protein